MHILLAPVIAPFMILLEYWKNLAVMFITFVLPIMPFVMIWDGTVSCLHCRLPFEVLDLFKTTAEKRSGSHGKALEGWSFKSVTDKQLLPPMAYANIPIGMRDE
jgi:hypothetical protein